MLKIKTGAIKTLSAELLMIPVAEDEALHSDPAARALIEKAMTYSEFKGEKGDELLLYQPQAVNAARVLFMGLGKAADIAPESLRKTAGKAVKKAIKLELGELLIHLPDARAFPIDAASAVQAFCEGAFLGNHIFDHYKEKKKPAPLKDISIFAADKTAKAVKGVAERVEIICKSTVLAREWVSMPPNEKRPDRFVRSITKAADKEGLEITVLDEPELKKNKMGGILGVGAGSKSRARMVILDYKPKKPKKTYALVGKGVTFDSGGINLKPGGSLEDMKMDMAGAASVAATLIAAARLKPAYRVVGVIPVVENMPSGDALRPGDIIRTYTGKTVEIGNTDAEGRMILIDAMAYTEKLFQPDIMIDMATLTGACIIALGEKIAGVFTTDRELSETIISAGETVFERCWAMPMPDDYREMLKSEFADIRNIGSSRWGGAIAAALFLSEFIENARWAHIDIAGPAYAKKASDYCGAGGTGFGVRLLIETMENL
mgnify:CR=1 FL=1